MLEGSIEEALSYGENCFMVYLGAPQNTFRKSTGLQHINEMQEIAKKNDILLQDIIVHAPYLVNLAQTDPMKHEFAVRFLTSELRGVASIGAKYLVVHPGAHMGLGPVVGIERIASGINEILDNTIEDDTCIAIETMAGKGTECGKSFEEIHDIISLIEDKSRIAVCLDTCHIHDAGYDIINHYEETIEEFDKIVGLDYLKVIHVNDSKNVCGAHKDRHENFGFGEIGFPTLMKFIYDERFKELPHILETPYVDSLIKKDSYPPYKEEIEMIRSLVFNPHLKEDVILKHE